MNEFELFIKEWIEEKGMSALKRGWPDFLCIDGDGSIFAIEAKAIGDKLSEDQIKMHKQLRKAGIHVSVVYEQDMVDNVIEITTGRRVISMKGSPRTRFFTEKREKVAVVLRDEKYSAWSQNDIAKLCGVSPATVTAVCKEMKKRGRGTKVMCKRNGATYAMKIGGQSHLFT